MRSQYLFIVPFLFSALLLLFLEDFLNMMRKSFFSSDSSRDHWQHAQSGNESIMKSVSMS